MPDPFVIVSAGLVGLIFGSFLNVCIVRLPADESILTPRSKCPKCGRQVAWFENIPIASWIALRAKCRGCGKSISVQYPVIEAVVGAIWGAAAWYYGLTLQAFGAAAFGTILLGIGVTDARHYLIPDEYTLSGLVLGLLLGAAGGLSGLTTALIGAATGFGLLYFVAWAGELAFKKEAMGGGDIKMMAMVGAFVGWTGVLLTVFGGALLGTLIFVPMSFGKEKRLVPFGVFLAAAAGITFVFGDEIVAWYIRDMLGG